MEGVVVGHGRQREAEEEEESRRKHSCHRKKRIER